MATALIANETAGCTLYEPEDNLQAFVNSIDLVQEPAIREFILEKIGQEVRRVKEKRDAVVRWSNSAPCRTGGHTAARWQPLKLASPAKSGVSTGFRY